MRFKHSVAVLLLFCTALTLVPTRRSEAGIGILVSFSPGLVISPWMIPVYYVLAIAGFSTGVARWQSAQRDGSGWKTIEALCMLTFGTLMLSQDEAGAGPAGMDFTHLNASEARRLGLTSAEWQAYESELPMLNAVREEVLLRADRSLGGGTLPLTREQVSDEIRSQWKSLSVQALSPDAIQAMEKLGRAVAQQGDLQ